VWQSAGWYRALSLTERRSLPGTPITGPPSVQDGLTARAKARLRAWKAQSPFDKGSSFAERLAVDSLTEQELLSLLAESAESLQARSPEPPGWLVALRDAFTGTEFAEPLRPLDDVERDHPLAGCLPALGPLFQWALHALDMTVQALRDQNDVLPFDAELAARWFVQNIGPGVLFQVTKPLVLELNINGLEGRLQGETPEARFEDFVEQLREDRHVVSFLAKYPVLARQLVVTVKLWADYLGRFLSDLCADWGAICATFSTDRDPGVLVDVDAGKGDPHRRGRSVLLLRFASGLQLLYKPKSLAADIHFQQLSTWLNDRGADPPLRPLVLLDRGEYGWSEYVTPASCASEEEVARFYQRQGSYLAVLYALDATDVHNENLIAAGEHPMLVDLEGLFCPHAPGLDPMLDNPAVGALDHSVWQVGLLPHRVWPGEDSVGVDVSGLGGHAGQMNPHRLVSWDESVGDDMQLGRRRAELPMSENRPLLDGREVDVAAYKEAIIAGFTRTYRLLCRHRDGLLTEHVPRFAHDEIRAFARPTNVYGLLSYESFHPDLLRDGLDRDRYFDRLWIEAAQRPHLARLVGAERRDLLRGDIPLFTTSPDSRTVFDSEGEPFTEVLDTPSLDMVRERIERLGEEDLVKQVWIIEASLATLLMDREDAFLRPVPVPASPAVVEPDQLLTLASSLGKRLGELALQNRSGASWLGVGPLDDTTWGLFPSGIDLYAGTPGIALALAYLGAITGQPEHTHLARAGLSSLRRELREWLGTELPAQTTTLPMIGGFMGLPSVIYLLTHLGVLWGERELLDEATELVEVLPPLISTDDNLDVIQGSAGCLLSLLSLHDVHPTSRAIDVATQCGDRLLATAQAMPRGVAWATLPGEPPLGGFSHGTTGIAFSLLQLAKRSGEERFRRCALEALEFDRSLFVPELNNWADVRTFSRPADSVPDAMVAWCHGAPGIGLGRLGALDELDDPTIRGEIDVALSTTNEDGFAMNHSLCHGAMGNVELLLMAARLLKRPQDQEALDRATAMVAASIEANGAVTGVPAGVETPGFMTGLAGIAYELLRLAAPDRVPCALLLAPPELRAES